MTRKIAAQVQSQKLVNDRRQRIIRAAITVFHRRGYHVATTADIAKEAGLTQSNLYNYVRSKQDVLFMVCEHLASLYEAALEEAVQRHSDTYDRLVEALRSVARVMNEYSDEIQLLYNETHSLTKSDRTVVLASISKFIDRFEELLSEYEAEHGAIRQSNKRLAANFLSFVPSIIALRSWDLTQHVDRGVVEKGIVQFTLEGLGIPEPQARRTARAPRLVKKG